jgi:hypothetical protein
MRKGTAIVLGWLLAGSIALAQIAPSKQVSGSITVVQGAVQLQTAGYASTGIQITGTFSQTLQFEGTTDGSTWAAVSVTPSSSTTTVTSATAAGLWTTSTAGLVGLRVRASAVVSGTAVITIVGNQTGARATGSGGGGGGSVTSITGTSDQVVASAATGAVTLSTPQSINTTSTPQFGRLGLGAAADSSAVAKFAGQYFSPLVAAGASSAGALTINWNSGNEQGFTLTENVTLTLNNPVDGGRYVLLIATGTGSFSVTWPMAVLWPGGVGPTITATASKVDLVTLIYSNGTSKYYGAFNQNY